MFTKVNPEKDTKIIVHTMGKVGSSSIAKSLAAYYSQSCIYHIHNLSPERLEKQIKKYQQTKNKLVDHLETSQYLLKNIEDRRNWKFITLTRDPVARNISAFFQNISSFIPGILEQDPKEIDICEIREIFFERYIHDLAINWIEQEIINFLGVDLESFVFPKMQGYAILRKPIYLIIIRLEDLNFCYKNAFLEFLGIDNFRLKLSNDSQSKKYRELYEKFYNGLDVPKDYIERMHGSWYARYFYTVDELRRLSEKYSSR